MAAAALLATAATPARAADPDALWRIVHARCVPDMVRRHRPEPCAGVTLDRGEAAGFALLKDIRGVGQYLLIPTARIGGIESPQLLRAGGPNYFAQAWEARHLVEARLGRTLPREDLALAVNSRPGRSQDQLHIHIDCIRPEVRAALDRVAGGIGERWAPLPALLAGHRYRAAWLPGEVLGSTDPFLVLAGSLTDPARQMGRHTLVLVGGTRKGQAGFVLLDGEAGLLAAMLAPWARLGGGSGEELEDHGCRIAAPSGIRSARGP